MKGRKELALASSLGEPNRFHSVPRGRFCSSLPTLPYTVRNQVINGIVGVKLER